MAARASGQTQKAMSTCTLRMVFMVPCEDEHMVEGVRGGEGRGEVQVLILASRESRVESREGVRLS
jgi:hypothetical protein